MARVSLYTVIFLLTLCSFAECSKLTSSQELQVLYGIFKDWIIKFNKQYGIEEIAIRFLHWKDNYFAVQDQNAKNDTFKLEMNSFADMNQEEFAALYLGLSADLEAARRRHHNTKHHDEAPKAHNATGNGTNSTDNATNATNATNSTEGKLPVSVDWRKEGAVTEVKNQGQCGGCWSFSAAGALEGLNAIKNKNLVNLSVQQMIDCSASYGNMGCEGGLMTAAFNYTLVNGIEPATGYEYAASVGDCRQNEQKVVFKNTGFGEVPANNASALKAAVAKQPVSVGIEASSLTIQLFKSGVISKGCSTNLDHGVLVVGYDVDQKGQEYWIVKNSWGPEWGLNGYFHIAMGDQNDGAGVCGINMMASYPTLEKDQE